MTNKYQKIAFAQVLANKKDAERTARQNYETARLNENFKTLDMRASQLSIEMGKAMAFGNDFSAIQKEYEKTCELKNAALDSIGMSVDDLIPHYQCKKCNDTGYCDGKLCDCVKKLTKAIVIDQLKEAHIPSFTFADFNTENVAETQSNELKEIYDFMQKVCDKFPDTRSLNYIFNGNTGVGKTCIASAVANELFQKGFSVVFMSAFDLNNKFLKYHTTPLAERADMLDGILDCDLLVIDDLGAEPVLKNVTVEYFLCVLSERESKRKHTIVTTNLTANEIMDRYFERLFSRLFDKSMTMAKTLRGDDLRYIKK